MQLKAILNSIEKHKGFVYTDVVWDPSVADKTLLIEVRPRSGSRGYCSGCGERSRTYDTMKPRRFQFVPLWGILVFFVYSMRRIDCKACGVTVEMVPWADGKKADYKDIRMVFGDVGEATLLERHGRGFSNKLGHRIPCR